ncbi:MAG: stage II sporulation protein P [Syntrophomonadaceae bacterium]|nr:stage II sporulation protein P [Syntrophomonadaceae bacterium]
MDTISKRYIWIFFSILITLMVAAYIINTISSPQLKPQPGNDFNSDKAAYVTVTDTQGNIILQTGIPVAQDDEYISAEDIHYVIISVKGNKAVAKVKKSNVSLKPGNKVVNTASISYPRVITTEAPARLHHMVIYHTHSDESYVPSSGKASKPGNGDVYEVGSVLAEALNKAGISTSQSESNHGPHDINAYHRSRRTVAQLLKERPDACFDIHRDSAPLSAYSTTNNGIPVSRVMIVVGRSNPYNNSNLAYAKQIKSAADELHPGLMRGIFIGKGDYNQDLYPTALIFEVGTEGNSLDTANRSVRLLADAIIGVTL